MKTIKLTIQKPAYGGYGLGFYDGKACFVDYAVPGDTATVEIYKEKKDYLFAKIITLDEEAVARIKPECPNFGKCGGCSYLNVSYKIELRQKKEILAETLTRISKLDGNIIPDISIISGSRFNYRSHASVKSDRKGNIGFFMKDSNELAPFPESGCCLLAKPLLHGLSGLRKYHRAEYKIACSYEKEFIASALKQNIVREFEAGIFYERDIKLFFQANRFLRSKMLETVKDFTGLSPGETFIDIGCGAGFFSIYLATPGNSGYGIDINRESIKWAKHNAQLNKRGNIEFETCSASEIGSIKIKFNAAVADPPRAGLSAKDRSALIAMSPERIVYVSCNPATFARDARDIIDAGYILKKIALIDMFPATYHIEAIALFAR
jgi:23S rRNA (uracil1939-C5)-methyltransferase